jgi:thymidylate synthase
MQQYLDHLRYIYENGHDHKDRTGSGRRSVFERTLRFNLKEGFPLDTSRPIPVKNPIRELLWFIAGSTDNNKLVEQGVNIWTNWALRESDIDKYIRECVDTDMSEEEVQATVNVYISETKAKDRIGSIGPMYGHHWRNAPQTEENRKNWSLNTSFLYEDIPSDKKLEFKEFINGLAPEFRAQKQADMTDEAFEQSISLCMYFQYVDQLNNLLVGLKKNPFGSRHIVSAWIPSDVPYSELSPAENVMYGKGALAACHQGFQCHVSPPKEEGGKLGLTLAVRIRSSDTPLGLPTNISQYALLTHMLAHCLDMEALELVVSCGDCHIYLNQLEFIEEHLKRQPTPLPTLWLNPDQKDLFAFKAEDIRIDNYNPVRPQINYPISI